MKIIKNTFTFLILMGAVGFSSYNIYEYSLSPCEKPLEYSIGEFDPRFGVSKEEFLKRVSEAELPWEKALGRNDLFAYRPDSDFKINLIYDQRQQTTNQKEKIESGLTASEEVLKKLDAEFAALKTKYEARVSVYENNKKLFEIRQRDYEKEVQYWNARGGAPKGEYEKLQAKADALNQEISKLNAEAIAINAESEELNALLERRNEAAENYNKIARSFNDKYGHGLEFNQAEYVGNPNARNRGEINLYQFGNNADMVLALTHEFGHALDMGHVENSSSIMYYQTNSTGVSPVLSKEDLVELERVCK